MKRQLFCILLILTHLCHGAAEPTAELAVEPIAETTPPLTLFQAIACTMINQTREIAEQIADYPKRIQEIIGDYTERKRTATAIIIYYIVDLAEKREFRRVECARTRWLPLIGVEKSTGDYFI